MENLEPSLHNLQRVRGWELGVLWILYFRLNLEKEDQDREVLAIYIRGPFEWEATVRAGSFRMGGPRILYLTVSPPFLWFLTLETLVRKGDLLPYRNSIGNTSGT